MKYQIVILLAVLVPTTHSLTLKLESSSPVCMKFIGNGSYVIEWISSGEDDHKVSMQLFENSKLVREEEGINDYRAEFKMGTGFFELCFKRLDSHHKEISFEVYKSSDPIKEMIDRTDLSYVEASLTRAIQSLEEVGNNQRYHIERDQINKIILEKSENHIKWAGFIKIAFLLTSALIQLWIMKSFFKQNTLPYHPIETQIH